MTVTATIVLAEGDARRLSTLLAENTEISPDAVDLHEESPGVWTLVVYLAEANATRKAALENALRGVAGRSAAAEWRDLPATDWVKQSQAALPPVRVGRILVYGEHDRRKVRSNDIAIAIEAGQAFGTGHHATTQGCLFAIQALLKAKDVRSALDVGTGSGVLAIALARHGIRVVATDVDPLAIAIARENARKNGVADRIAVALMPRSPTLLPGPRRATYDLIVANILLGPLLTLAPAIGRAVAAHGHVVLSGLLPAQRAPIVATYRSVGLHLRCWFVQDGWLTLTLART